MERFVRTQALLGAENWQRLQECRITIIGMGAVGSYATEALCRSGVGSLRLVDFDTVSISNINRQLYALSSTLNRPKVEVAAERVQDINPDCRVEALQSFVHTDTLDAVLDSRPDLVIDAIDSVTPKVALLRGVWERQIPLLSSMGAALRTDPTRISLGDIMDTSGCPLARAVRTRLRRQGIGRGITCVYSTEPVSFHYGSAGRDGTQRTINRGLERNVLGSLPTLTGIFGLMLANQAIKLLTSYHLQD
ncbi:tRNA threonylcarbamoyladenosine dehydratase [Spirochaeta africana]|uniref:Dinucleotide-utilizing enzyme possibly involved in molybdopterin or thiamin biosynthesis n=1 Tax=Spirochaeta africana (strain ATCC 700263 / DSM 8902 / Z-7692) TaxID=889378 RepID=H9UMB5_SPIAZ|nr:tRNA threonylcarbamoyladenosine dehydratase [Spirochaeta africana]AFG38658.1 dinucleotide-utilizing enzyme possibly involved in molybdopterin or thiamin biosynthesis [Spirochaeta africana DSM 8902]